ncbi:arylsulfatase [Corallococcus sp. H22C18031201]|uniref:arylsulfatase n=1 Tax=Citreicoccus inhibens TaxID=2849499 RepID=UPI000E75930E|nr:arylsulfatase [Citreicoccus inhibens]MBU8895854.1 arylsulfatase [Citreicoccus inhibens]RJS23862.1 arylsulfatase [Corallococcus sp. H22C18031201]
MALKEYPRGSTFPGVIGRTWEQSSPAWPAPIRARQGAPNVLFIVLDDTGFGHLGCYGSPIRTPNLDRLARGGLLYNNMHTTALCSPTRSCILTGRNHHSNGMATITEVSLGYPGYNGTIPFENGFLSEMLLEHGYNTYALGKWHLTPAEQTSAAGPYNRWPLGRGFERFYGFLGGDTHQYYPDLVHDNHPVPPPRTPEEGYHLTEDLVDRAIGFIADTKQVAPDKPFFLYFATGAMHAPHHVRKEWSDRYRGQFDDGWDAYRKKVFQRQLELGIVPPGTQLSRHDPDVQDWDALPPEEKRLYARMMEVFAGFLEHTDHHIGRLLDALEESGELENTLVMVISDNGASPEGGPHGSVNELKFFNNTPESLEQNLQAMDALGGPQYFNHYAWGWAWAGDTPFRRWKRETYRGGTTDPFIVHWPRGIPARGELRTQYCHAIDMVPTVLDCLGISPPEQIRGVTQSPLEGVSFKHSFTDAQAPSRHVTQYFEMFSNRALYHDGWRAVCPFPGPSFKEAGEEFGASKLDEDRLRRLDAEGWELYHVAEDCSETRNVAEQNRGKLIEMIALWYVEAGKYQVLPLASPDRAVFSAERPQISPDRQRYVYRPNTSPVPENVAAHVLNRPHTITADVEVTDGAEGVLLCHGGITGGYSFFIKDHKLHYLYNFVGEREFHLESAVEVPRGHAELRFEFEPTGKPDLAQGRGTPGRGRLYINGDLVAQSDIDATMPLVISLGEGLTCGRDDYSPTSSMYEAPFVFTGDLHQVVVDVSGEHLHDEKAEQNALMARQ